MVYCCAVICFSATRIVVPTSNKPTPTTTIAVFIFDHAISFNAPFTRVKVEAVAAAPAGNRHGSHRFCQCHRRGLHRIRRHRAGNHGGRQRHAAFHKPGAQFFQRAGHALLRRVGIQTQCLAHFFQRFLLVKAQDDGVAVRLRSILPRRHRSSGEEFATMLPAHGFIQKRVHVCLLFRVDDGDVRAPLISVSTPQNVPMRQSQLRPERFPFSTARPSARG